VRASANSNGVKQEVASSSSTRLPTTVNRPPAPTASKPPPPKDKAPVKPAVTDMTFFGAPPPSAAPKPKPKLPDIKKRDPSAPPSIAAPSTSGTSSLLSATMSKLLKKSDSPVPGPAPLPGTPAEVIEHKPKVNKKGHMVRFNDLVPDGGDLVSIRVFSQAEHELDAAPWQDDVHGMSTHQLDMDEGKALRAHEGIEEVIDWYEPDGESASSEK